MMRVDIFAISDDEGAGDTGKTPIVSSSLRQIQTTFAVGEEAEQAGTAVIRDVGKVVAPVDAAGASLEPGSTARVDVVVRTRKIGHFLTRFSWQTYHKLCTSWPNLSFNVIHGAFVS